MLCMAVFCVFIPRCCLGRGRLIRRRRLKKNAPAFRPGLTNSLCQALLDRASPSSFLKKEIPSPYADHAHISAKALSDQRARWRE